MYRVQPIANATTSSIGGATSSNIPTITNLLPHKKKYMPRYPDLFEKFNKLMNSDFGSEYLPKVSDPRLQAQTFTKFVTKPKKKGVKVQFPDHLISATETHNTSPFTASKGGVVKQEGYNT